MDVPDVLLVFDFDHTLVDGNTDTWVGRAHPGGNGLPPHLAPDTAAPGEWTAYMNRVLSALHDAGVQPCALQQCLESLPYTPGMQTLLERMREVLQRQIQPCATDVVPPTTRSPCIDAIIISDSNSAFIGWILAARGHKGLFSAVYTNPATVMPDGRLEVAPHHQQQHHQQQQQQQQQFGGTGAHRCTSCPANMCKAAVLHSHLSRLPRRPKRILYVGDGRNDLCPALRILGPRDIVLARRGFALDAALATHATSPATVVAATVCQWTQGSAVLCALEEVLAAELVVNEA